MCIGKHLLAYNDLKGLAVKPGPSSSSFEQSSLISHLTKTKKYSKTDHRQVALTNALVSFVAGDLLPLSIIDSPQFHRLMETADGRCQMPSRNYFSQVLMPQKFGKLCEVVIAALKRPDFVCTTVDLWTNTK